jgi:multimeric flavodoxin WrbA
MKTLLIVYQSSTGGTRQMVEAIARGAGAEPDLDVQVKCAADATSEDLMTADAYVFAAPENLGAIAGLMKDFFDRTYYAVHERINGRPYAILVCAGSDGSNAARQMQRIATGWRLRLVAEPVVVCTHAQTAEAILSPKVIDGADLRRCEEIGATLASGVVAGIF